MDDKILIVDDEPAIGETLKEILLTENYRVDTAGTGKDALAMLGGGRYDLVIIDRRMPDMSGLELLAEIQRLSPPPVAIILTGHASLDSAVEAMRQGAYDYLTKPCHPEELRWAVRRGLDRKRLSDSEAFQKKMEILYEVSKSVAGMMSVDSLLPVLTQRLCEVTGLPRCLIWLLSPNGEALEARAANSPIQGEVKLPFTRETPLFEILQQGREIVVENAQRDKRVPWVLRSILKRIGLQAFLAIPIIIKGKLLGILSLDAAGQFHRFSYEEVRLASFLADQAGVGLENARLYQEEREKSREYGSLARIATMGSQTLDPEVILQVSVEKTIESMEVEDGVIFLVDPETLTKTLSSHRGGRLFSLLSKQQVIPSSLEGQILFSRKPVVIEDLGQQSRLTRMARQQLRRAGLESFLGVALRHKDRPLGVLAVGGAGRKAYTPRKIDLILAIAHQVAVSIENVRLLDDNRRHQEALRQLSLSVLSAQEEERRRISRELHDATGQALLALKLRLQMLSRRIPLEMTQEREELQEADQITTQAMEEIRGLVADLRPPKLDDLGLAPTLRGVVKDFANKFGVNVKIKQLKLLRRLPSDMEVTLYRIFQEALTNVAKHAKAKNVYITLERLNSIVRAVIMDDGVGFDPTRALEERRNVFGLVGIQERTSLLGGRCTVESNKGWGTKLVIELPLQSSPEVRRIYLHA